MDENNGIQANGTKIEAGIVISISNKTNFKLKPVSRDITYILKGGKVYQKCSCYIKKIKA